VSSTPGLGEKLVSGQITPEEIRIDAQSGEIVERRLPKDAEPLPDWLRGEVADVTRLAAERFGFPQDLEWASEGQKLYILQSRPITTIAGVFYNRPLEPWLLQGKPDAIDRVWTRAYADEIWTPPVSPLFYDVQNLTLATVQRLERDGDWAPTPPDIFKYFRAAPYMDAAVLERMYSNLPVIARRSCLLPLLPPERRAALSRAPWYLWRFLGRIWQFEVVKGRTWGVARNYKFLEQAWRGFLQVARPLCSVELSQLSEASLDDYLAKSWRLVSSVGAECEVAVLYYAHDIKLILSGLLERWCGAGEECYGEVSAGLEKSETVRETQEIWEIAAALRSLGPTAIAGVNACDWSGFRARSREFGAQAVTERLERFLRDHPQRGANYKDLIYPRWGDNPELLWMHVRAFVEAESAPPIQANTASATRRQETQRDCLSKIRGPLAPVRRAVLRALFLWNERYSALRDNHRFYYDFVWWFVRRYYAEVGRRLQLQHRLANVDDIYFLVRTEIDALRQGRLDPDAAAVRIDVRKREWRETKRTPPARFLRRGYVPDEATTLQQVTGASLKGIAASAGQVIGRARVVYDVTDLARVHKGEILVTRQTDPGWTPAFARIGGLLLETGGVLAHGASLCREYGLPCVTAIEAVTSLIGDGDLVSVSGSDGTVQILEIARAAHI
jgi:phosphohistidine swiveling domain-containing protein